MPTTSSVISTPYHPHPNLKNSSHPPSYYQYDKKDNWTYPSKPLCSSKDPTKTHSSNVPTSRHKLSSIHLPTPTPAPPIYYSNYSNPFNHLSRHFQYTPSSLYLAARTLHQKLPHSSFDLQHHIPFQIYSNPIYPRYFSSPLPLHT